MKVSQDKIAAEQLRKTQLQSLKNMNIAREQEIEGLKKINNKKVEEERIRGQEQVWETQDQGKIEFNKAVQDKERKLDLVRKQLDEDKTRLEKEKENITKDYRSKISYTTQFYDQKNKETYDNALVESKDIQEKKRAEIQEVAADKSLEIQSLESQANSQLLDIGNRHRRRISEQSDAYQTLQRRELLRHEEKLENLTAEHKVELDKQLKTNIKEKNDKQVIHQEEIKRQDEYHQALLLQEKEAFEKRYSLIQKNHQEMIDRIQERFDHETSKMLEANADKRHAVEERIDDEFYHVNIVDHKVQDLGDSYLVSIDLPEHEKETVVLSVDQRTVNFNFTRRFKESLQDQSGAFNRTRRSEVYSKSFELPSIMDPTKITREYQEGVLSFKIGKA